MFLSAFIKPCVAGHMEEKKKVNSGPLDRDVYLPTKLACIFHNFPLVPECAYARVRGLGLLLWLRSKGNISGSLSKIGFLTFRPLLRAANLVILGTAVLRSA